MQKCFAKSLCEAVLFIISAIVISTVVVSTCAGKDAMLETLCTIMR